MDWPALVTALRPFGFYRSEVFGLTAHRWRDGVVVRWGLDGLPVEVWRSRLAGELDRPPLFSGSPEEVVEWLEQREGVTTCRSIAVRLKVGTLRALDKVGAALEAAKETP